MFFLRRALGFLYYLLSCVFPWFCALLDETFRVVLGHIYCELNGYADSLALTSPSEKWTLFTQVAPHFCMKLFCGICIGWTSGPIITKFLGPIITKFLFHFSGLSPFMPLPLKPWAKNKTLVGWNSFGPL